MSRTVLFSGIVFGGLFVWATASGGGKRIPLTAPTERDQPLIASIRGVDGRGNGPMSSWLKTPPPDLTRIAARNGGTFPLDRVARIISGEEPLPSGHGTRAMPVWGPVFSQVSRDEDLGRVRIDNIARYLRDIQSK